MTRVHVIHDTIRMNTPHPRLDHQGSMGTALSSTAVGIAVSFHWHFLQRSL